MATDAATGAKARAAVGARNAEVPVRKLEEKVVGAPLERRVASGYGHPRFEPKRFAAVRQRILPINDNNDDDDGGDSHRGGCDGGGNIVVINVVSTVQSGKEGAIDGGIYGC